MCSKNFRAIKFIHVKCHRTRATISEVCINYIRGICQRAGTCSRIHPVDKASFLKIFREHAKNSRRNKRLANASQWQRQKASQEPVPFVEPMQNSDVPLFGNYVEHSVSLEKFSESITGSITDQESRMVVSAVRISRNSTCCDRLKIVYP